MQSSPISGILTCLFVLFAAQSDAEGLSPTLSDSSLELVIDRMLVLPPPANGYTGRMPVHRDAIEEQIVRRTWSAPRAGDKVKAATGETSQWTELSADSEGVFSRDKLGGSYLYAEVTATHAKTMLLIAAGHSLAYVNGEPRSGDPYGYGYVKLPVALREGKNTFLLLARQDKVQARLIRPPSPILLNLDDVTTPDLVQGETQESWLGVVVVNATGNAQSHLTMRTTCDNGAATVTLLPPVPAMSTRKVPVKFKASAHGEVPTASVRLELLESADGEKVTDRGEVRLRVRRPSESRKIAFLSQLDGSVQYYALRPSGNGSSERIPPALFFSLHGASVEADKQADAYSLKPWGDIVAPTNRRPYGFDWEDWGRLDALEVLSLATQSLRPDPARIYLTGHSMGGHGSWQLASTYPDRFGAVGPSAGWISFFTYTGSAEWPSDDPVAALLRRAANSSDTLLLIPNLARMGVYILHGDADDNVPVTEARAMREKLAIFHRDFTWHEQPKAKHWWDDSDEPGASCVDWPPMFDFFARHARPAPDQVRDVDFITVNPGVSAWCQWAGIEQQIRPLFPSQIKLRWNPGLRQFVGTTSNIAHLAISVAHVKAGGPVSVELDGQKLPSLPWPADRILRFRRDREDWLPTGPLPATEKGPRRNGMFKSAWCARPILVYGTHGTPEENAWATAKARLDAETWWYRGNGAVDVVADDQFDAAAEPDRGVILYGNAETNGAWPALLEGSPVTVMSAGVRLGDREIPGIDLACLFVRPRPGSDTASVAVIAGTGPVGMRLTDRMNHLIAGIAYPDVTVIGADSLHNGFEGVRAAGFFGNDWSIDPGEFTEHQKTSLP